LHKEGSLVGLLVRRTERVDNLDAQFDQFRRHLIRCKARIDFPRNSFELQTPRSIPIGNISRRPPAENFTRGLSNSGGPCEWTQRSFFSSDWEGAILSST
jgi:hypothetical protein